ncbi:urease accessory protein UreF [Roseivivax sp. GX 12232]|uniref:urease accessory protein UreF n=1 Tax=Roseivivax sp. GX 12232 TaxID=2900547 RepID=UPI001E3C72F3|nr:urease accessory UreF family protein [Roseivivax sp. GX 12232]MCE0505787.1 urease accessory protein UreF [Roseivivax sp. GX 12232]
MPEAGLVLHQLFSPAFPTGGFAYSHGLETLVAEARLTSGAELEAWLADWLSHGAGWSDAVLFAQAAAGADPAPLAELAAALSGAAHRRRETALTGAAFAATARRVWGLDLPDMAYPVAAGRAVHLLRLDPGAALEACLMAAVQTYAGAAMRLVPLGQGEGQAAIAGATPRIAATARAALSATLDEIGGFAPALDIAAMRHEALETKLFRS